MAFLAAECLAAFGERFLADSFTLFLAMVAVHSVKPPFLLLC